MLYPMRGQSEARERPGQRVGLSCFLKVALVIGAPIITLGGCGNGAPALMDGNSDGRTAIVTRAFSSDVTSIVSPTGQHYSRRKLKPTPIEKGGNLLYITDYITNEVQVYNYPPKGSGYPPVETLYDSNGPQGACTDNTGKNVFVTSSKSSQIFEYKYGAKKPRLALNDANQIPVGCAVDSRGNLAVTNIRSLSNGNGSISVYTAPLSPSSVPTIYSDPSMSRFYFITYDPQGNIFADGFTTQKYFGLTELNTAGTFTDLTLSNAVLFPGGVSYDAERGFVTVGDQLAQKIYGYAITGAYAQRKQTTLLRRGYDVVQYYLKSGFRGVVAPDANSYPPAVYSYRYPKGGLPIASKTIVGGPLTQPLGAAIARP